MRMRFLLTFVAIPWFVAMTAANNCAYAWSGSTHAFIAERCLAVERIPLASYNARMGSLVPDFFWYLKYTGQLEPAYADLLHGFDSQPDIDPESMLYEAAMNTLTPWNTGLFFFTEGIKIHVFADIQIHNLIDGYLGGQGMWVDMLQQKTGLADRDALHLALEFAIDALLIQTCGCYQLADLKITYRQADFLASVIPQLTGPTDIDYHQQFKQYVALMRMLEKAAGAYGPYLTTGTLTEEFLRQATSKELLDTMRSLSSEAFSSYLAALQVLRDYPAEIYETLTGEVSWQESILTVIEKWQSTQ